MNEPYSENWTYSIDPSGGLNGHTAAYVIKSGDYIVAELDFHYYGQDERQPANRDTLALALSHAKKIAALPDLIEALKQLLHAAENSNVATLPCDVARAALKKASA